MTERVVPVGAWLPILLFLAIPVWFGIAYAVSALISPLLSWAFS